MRPSQAILTDHLPSTVRRYLKTRAPQLEAAGAKG
jgi:hypothetical protein